MMTLLPPQLRAQCEGWKLAYADFLLRCDLLRVRAELLQHQFLRGDGVPQRAVGGDVPVLASGPRADTRGGSQGRWSRLMITGADRLSVYHLRSRV